MVDHGSSGLPRQRPLGIHLLVHGMVEEVHRLESYYNQLLPGDGDSKPCQVSSTTPISKLFTMVYYLRNPNIQESNL